MVICHRRRRRMSISGTLMPAFMITYFLLLMFLLIKIHVYEVPFTVGDAYISSPSNHKESKSSLVLTTYGSGFYDNTDKNNFHPEFLSNVSREKIITELGGINPDFVKSPPVSVLQRSNHSKTGTFYTLKSDIFIYSAYFDDRKDEAYVRLLILATDDESRSDIFCLFRDEIYNIKRQAIRYEMCENHHRYFGGYIFSCQVPDFLNIPVSSRVNVSCNECSRVLTIPLAGVRPPAHKLNYLNSYPEEPSSYVTILGHKVIISGFDSEIFQNTKDRNSPVNEPHQKVPATVPPLSFAVCVPPLFGDISPYRLIEFIELSLLLGADHIFFYKFSIPGDVAKVVSYYVNKGVVTVTPWSLPSSVTSNRLWYNGQLLAHNDCLYRSMSRYDLVAFNDIDEFIVPHTNSTSTSAPTWQGTLSKKFTNTTCGFSFQSAFFDTDFINNNSPDLQTLKVQSRTKSFSKVRSKVIACPWRVFEVGIHHISKQNREAWRVQEVDTSTSFLHHYRGCIDNYDMSCRDLQRDSTIGKRYRQPLKIKYDAAISDIDFRGKKGRAASKKNS